MASFVPPKKNDSNGYVFYISLISQSNPLVFQANPTLAAGDVKVCVDDGAPANITTLAAVDGDHTKRVKVTLNQAETNGDNITVTFQDAAGDEWCDLTVNIHTSAQTLDEVQSQLGNITNIGAAISTPPRPSPNGFAITTSGTETNNEDSAAALDGTYHTIADDSGALDVYYEFDIGGGIPASVVFTGYVTGKNDDLGVYGYDWVSSAWVQIGTLLGKNTTTNEVDSFDLFTTMVGNAANEGKVRVRFYAASGLTTALLATDQIYVSFSRSSEGYDNGSIWIDTNYSNTGTVVGIDGTARNPVSTIAAANTLATSTNLNRFAVAPGSSITLAASQDDQIFMGHDWTLALGGQSVSGSYVEGAIVSGIATGASLPTFVECTIGTVTLPPCELRRCGLTATITGGSAGNYHFNGCFSEVAGTGTPVFDFGSGVASTNLNVRHYSGGIDLRNMGQSDTDTASIEGFGQVVVNANCIGGTLVIRGLFTLTNNGTLDTLTTDAQYSPDGIADAVWDEDITGHETADTAGRVQSIMMGKWQVIGNQLICTGLSGTVLYTFNLTQDGAPTQYNPDLRTPV